MLSLGAEHTTNPALPAGFVVDGMGLDVSNATGSRGTIIRDVAKPLHRGSHLQMTVLLTVFKELKLLEPSIHAGFSLIINGTYHHHLCLSGNLTRPQTPLWL
jgi:hypothetical protein